MSEKKQRTSKYHLMLFIDKSDGGVHQMGIGSIFVEVLAFIIVVALAVTIFGWTSNYKKNQLLTTKNAELTTQVEELTGQNAELSSENAALNDKVTILSNTVNSKVEQETAIQEEADAAHFPEGFPLSASASISTNEDDPYKVTLSSNEGSSIIATGAGTIAEVLPDTDYGYCIRIDHENGYVTEYYTSSTPLIREGDAVLQGAILALVESNDSKLIYKVFKDGEPVEPMSIIKIDG